LDIHDEFSESLKLIGCVPVALARQIMFPAGLKSSSRSPDGIALSMARFRITGFPASARSGCHGSACPDPDFSCPQQSGSPAADRHLRNQAVRQNAIKLMRT
jgi:hypothetical protein